MSRAYVKANRIYDVYEIYVYKSNTMRRTCEDIYEYLLFVVLRIFIETLLVFFSEKKEKKTSTNLHFYEDLKSRSL